MLPDLVRIAGAYMLAGLVAWGGYIVHALTRGGALAACIVGGTIFGFGGFAWAFLLLLFFASSSGLSFFKAGESRKRRAAEIFEKGGRRDAAQVLANGGVAACLAGLAGLSAVTGPDDVTYLFAGFAGSLAAATADTWATEIGVLSRSAPRLVTTLRQVDAGTSGAVTWAGSLAALAGALLIAVASALAIMLDQVGGLDPQAAFALLVAAATGGVAGSFVDSFLGATVQASYRCPRCDKPTESSVHSCGTEARLVSGMTAVNNDIVNTAATLAGALLATAAYTILTLF